MTLKRLLLTGLTLLVTLLITLELLSSLAKPQVQSQLELYQTNLLLQASEWQGLKTEDSNPPVSQALLGDMSLQSAIEQYEQARASLKTTLQELPSPLSPSRLPPDLAESPAIEPNSLSQVQPEPPANRVRANLEQQFDRLDLRLGLLYVKSNQVESGLQLWQQLSESPRREPQSAAIATTAAVLNGLWSNPPQLLPQANEMQLQQVLTGWFRYQALSQLYQLQQRQSALLTLEAEEQQQAELAFARLALLGGLPALGCLLGIGVLLFWAGRSLLRRHHKTPILEATTDNPGESGLLQPTLSVPWDGEMIWQVMVLWFTAFFLVSFIVVPIISRGLNLNPATLTGRTQALLALFNYSLLMVTGLSILFISLRRFEPLRWFPLRLRGGWFWWGLGGYFAALPLVILVSLLGQQVLREQGGGNPLLEIILQSQDNLTVMILFGMVAGLAPLFEETLFRGFFLTSLTRYLPAWGAIALSGVVFAIAHLSLAEILPLTVLGMMLGYVYLRSRNLLASMLLHSLWNSGSFLGLLLLSGGS